MNWGDIKKQWQTGHESYRTADTEPLTTSIRSRQRDMIRKVRRRDIVETVVALLIAPIFGFQAWSLLGKGQWIAGLAAAVLTAWCLFVPWRLKHARKLYPDPDSDNDMMAYLVAERRATAAQYALLKNVFWWYLLPAGIGVTLFFIGMQGLSVTTFMYSVFVAVLYGFIYRANRRAADLRFRPALEQIDRQIKYLQELLPHGENE